MRIVDRSLFTAAALFALAGACVPPPPTGPVDESALVIEAAPPEPVPEAISDPPWPGAVWIGGYWNWTGVRFVWLGGRWERPTPGFRWMPHRWERRAGHFRFVPGHWISG
jgi:hypothetical protein